MSTLDPEDNQSVECPECGEFFDGVGGMRTHYGAMHDGSLARSTYTCEWCETEYKEYDHEHEGKKWGFCSMDCRDNFRSKNLRGERHPNHVERVTVECEDCGSDIERLESQLKNGNHFCNKDCLGNWRSENICGENHPRYSGGAELDYGPDWQEQRKKAIERDGECRLCGMSRQEHNEIYEYDITVHHITKLRKFKDEDGEVDYDAANDLSNLLTLCYSCHGLWESLPIQPEIVD